MAMGGTIQLALARYNVLLLCHVAHNKAHKLYLARNCAYQVYVAHTYSTEYASQTSKGNVLARCEYLMMCKSLAAIVRFTSTIFADVLAGALLAVGCTFTPC